MTAPKEALLLDFGHEIVRDLKPSGMYNARIMKIFANLSRVINQRPAGADIIILGMCVCVKGKRKGKSADGWGKVWKREIFREFSRENCFGLVSVSVLKVKEIWVVE